MEEWTDYTALCHNRFVYLLFYGVNDCGGFVTMSAVTSAFQCKTIWIFQGRHILFICPKPVLCCFFVLNESLNLFFYNKDY